MQRYIDELRLLQAIRLSVVATDRHGIITFVNEAGAETYAADADDLIGLDVRSLLSPDAPAIEGGFDFDAVMAGLTWRGDLTVRRPHGETFVAAVSATPTRDRDGEITGAVVVAEDMTEIREAEAEAEASQQRLRLAHEAAELGSWHWDMTTGVTVWDEQLEAIYGMPPGGFDGTFEAWLDTVHPDDRERVLLAVQEAIDARSSYVLRNRVNRSDGTLQWIEAHGKVTTDDQGNPSGTIGCVRDITDRVLVQEREQDAAARARLLQQVTADFGRAWTPEQVAAVLGASLVQVADIVGTGVRLVVPEDLVSVSGGDALRGEQRQGAPARGRAAARHARRAVRHRGRAGRSCCAGPPASPSSCSPASRRARCPTSTSSSSRCTTPRGATTWSTWAATGTTPCGPARGPWPSSSAT